MSLISVIRSWLFRVQLTLGIPAIAEVVLFAVSIPEDVVAGEVDSDNQCSKDGAKFDLLEDKVAGLEGIHKWYPSQVANGKHKAEPVGGNIHGSEDRRLEGSEREKEVYYKRQPRTSL